MGAMRFEELEPRILYAADAALLLGAAGLDASAEVRVLPAPVLTETAVQATPHEIVFIDPRVPDAQQLVDDLLRQRGAGRLVEIVTLKADEDGVQQIGRVLAGEHDLAVVHIISHGSAGEVDIGSTRLDAAALAAHAASIEAWRAALGQGADILLYGCDVAEGRAGEAFAQQLARLSGADVAASTDLTGSAARGGNWTLEYSTGHIDAALAPSAAARAAWAGVLAGPVIDLDANNSSGATGSGYAGAWTEGAGPAAVADSDATLTSPGSPFVASMTVAITNRVNGSAETLAANTAGTLISASFNAATGVLSLTGTDIAANYQKVLRTVTYDNSADEPTNASRVISVTASDGFNTGNTATATLAVTRTDDAPTAIVLLGTAATNLVNNGSFEVNNVAPGIQASGAAVTVAGWTATGGEGFEVWNGYNNATSPGPASASDGTTRLELDVAFALNGITQNVATQAGQSYLLSFDFAHRSGAAMSGVDVYWRGNLIGTLKQNVVAWQTYNFVVTGSGGADALAFVETADTNDGVGSQFDNVKLMAIAAPAPTVAENAANGTPVATAATLDPDGGDSFTYSLTDSAGGRFAVNAATGLVSVANGAAIDYESATSHAITLRSTDSGGLYREQVFTIGVTDVNEAPQAVADTAIAVEAGGATNVVPGVDPSGNVLANDTDPDAGDGKTVTGVAAGSVGSASGNVASAVAGSYGSVIVAADGSYTYTLDNANPAVQALQSSSTTLTDTFTYTMRDAGGLASSTTLAVTIRGVNDAPTLTNGASAGLGSGSNEDGATAGFQVQTIVNAVGGADVDASAQHGMALTGVVGNGSLQYSTDGVSWRSVGAVSASNALLLAPGSSLRYVGDGQNGETISIAFRAWDLTSGSASTNAAPSYADPGAGGGSSAFSSQSAGASAIVASVNDAPVLDATKSPVLTAATEDDAAPSGAVGTLVSALVDFANPAGQVDNVSDVDNGALLGIAVTGADASHGSWYFSTDNGASWNAIGSTSDGAARLLAADAGTRLYFKGAPDFNGTLANAITFRAWDRSSGANGGVADTSTNGGTSAFSAASDSASLVVTAVNDAPVITSNGGGASATVAVAETLTAVTTVTATDVDGDVLSFSIVGGADAAKFTIDATSGALAFITAPDFEHPTDAGGDNVYHVVVQVSDGSLADTQALAVGVTDVANTLTVTGTGDVVDGDTSSIEALNASKGADGRISLREAILAANNTTNQNGPDVISFNIADALVGGAHTIMLTAQLPDITDAMVLDASSEPDWASGAPVVVLDGGGTVQDGLRLAAGSDGSTLRGFVIKSFTRNGIDVTSSGNTIAGNLLGTAAGGATAAGNLNGIVVSGGNDNVIGGSAAADRNVISGNTGVGVLIGGGAARTRLLGNFIGTDASGQAVLGNGGNGVRIQQGATGSLIGGTGTADGNRIAGNGGAGIAVVGAGSTGNALLGNRIESNAGLGIDLGATGVDTNDPGDADSGANDLQNTPVLTGAVSAGSSTTIVGTLNSTASTTFRIEFFVDIVGDPSGHGQAPRYLGFDSVTTDAAGNASFSTTLAGVAIADGWALTATATVDNGAGSYGSTSEFAANLLLVNHAPVLDASRSPQLGTLVEDAGAPSGAAGSLVSALVDFATPAGQNDNVTDADPLAQLGIALTAADASRGSWWYSVDNGANWLALGAVNDGAARLLAADGATRLYFQSNADWSGTLAAAIGFRAWDRTAGSNGGTADATVNGGSSAFSAATATAALTVTPVNDAPLLGYLQGGLSYVENAAPLLLAPAASVSDVDSPDFDGGQLVTTITANALPEDRLTVQDQGNGAGQVGVSGVDIRYGGVLVASFNGAVSGGTALVITFNANADAAAVQAVARRVSYQNLSEAPSAAVRTIEGVLTDGDGGSSATTAATLAVTPVNDAPVINVVAPRTTNEDVVKVFSLFIGNAITLADADAGNGLLQLSVSATHGTLTLGHLSGLGFSVGDGTADTTMTFTGTLAALNNALDGIAYQPDANYNGPASLAFSLNDLGNSGSGGALTATATQVITVLPVNDAPTLNDGTAIALAPTDEDTPGAPVSVASLLADGALGYADVDGGAPYGLAVTGTTGRGRWQFSNDGLAWADIGSVSAGNALLLDAAAQLRYLPDGLNGEAVGLTFRAWDGSAGIASTGAAPSFAVPGAGGGSSAFSVGSAALTLAVAAVDDAPTQLLLVNPAAPAQPVTVAENSANGTLVGNAVAIDPDVGDSASFTLLDSAGGRFAIDAATGALRVADGSRIDFETATAYAITVRATDSGGLTLDRAFTIAVTDVNEPIVAVPDSALAVEAGGVANALPGIDPSGNVFANDSDPDAGDSKTLVGVLAGSANAAAGNVGTSVAGSFGTITIGADGRYVYRVDNTNAAVQALHNAGTTLTDTFTYSVRDTAGLVSTAQLTVTIAGANDLPVLTANAGLAIAENATGTVIGNTLLAASDVDNGAAQLVYTLTAAPAHGTLRLAGTALAASGSFTQADIDAGRLSYDHDGSETTADGFAFTLDDGGGIAASGNFAIAIMPVNDHAPMITSNGGGTVATVTVAENTRAVTTVMAFDADLPAATLVFSIAGGADAARFTIDAATGALRFATAPDFEAPADANGDNVYDVLVQASDGTLTGTQAIAVTVTNVNEAPVAAAGPLTFVLDEDQPLAVAGPGVLASVSDPDGDRLTALLIGGPAHAGTFTLNADGSFHYTPSADWSGSDSFSFAASDGRLSTGPITVVLTVRPVDDAPTLPVNAGLTVAEGSTANVIGPALLAAADIDNTAAQLVFTLSGGPAHGGLRLGGVQLGAGDRFTQADIDAGRLSYDHDGSETTADGFAFSVDDGAGGSVAGTFAIAIMPVNDHAPVITSNGGGAVATVTVAENTSAVTTVTAFDADLPAATLVFSIAGGADAARFTIDAATGALRFATAPDFEAPADANGDNVYDVLVQASDGTLTGTQAIAVTVTNVNEAPVAAAGPLTFVLDEDQPLSVAGPGVLAHVSDPDGDPLTAILLSGPAHAGAFTLNADGSFHYTPSADWSGSDSFSFAASDGAFTTRPVTVVLTVRPVDDAPQIVSDGGGATAAVSVSENTQAVTVVQAVDIDGPAPVSYAITGGADAARFRVDATTGALAFATAPDFETPGDAARMNRYVVIVSAASGSLSTQQTITVTVTDVDEAPQARDATVTLAEDSVYRFGTADFGFTDPDAGDALGAVRIDALPAAGTLQFGGAAVHAGQVIGAADLAQLSFAPAADANGSAYASLGFSVADRAGQWSAGATLRFDVASVNDAPVIVSDGGGAVANLTLAENGTAVTVVHATDVDLPASPPTYRIAGGADAALFAIDAQTGALRFVDAPDFEAPRDAGADNVYDLTVEAFDGQAAAQQRLHIAVTDVNEAPSSVDVALAAVEDTPLHFSAADLGFRDADAGDRLGAVSVEAIGGGGRFALLAADGTATPVTAGQTIAAADIARLAFTPDADANGAHYATLVLRVQDAAGLRAAAASTLTINVAAVDDAPTLTSARLVLQPGLPLNLDAADIAAHDIDSTNLSFVVSDVRFGRFETVADPGVAIDHFTQADALAGRVRFVAFAVNPLPSFNIAVSDGTQTSRAMAASIGVAPGAGITLPVLAAGHDGRVQALTDPAGRGVGEGNATIEMAATGAGPTGEAAVPPSAAAEAPRVGNAVEAPDAAARPAADVSARGAALRQNRPQRAEPVPDLVVELSGDDADGFGLRGAQDAANALTRGAARLSADVAGPADDDEGGTGGGHATLLVQATRAAGAALTAGTVWWALRAGGLVASLLVVLPAWRHVDLLAVLPDEEDDPWERLGGAGDDDEAARDEQAVRRVFEPVLDGGGR